MVNINYRPMSADGRFDKKLTPPQLQVKLNLKKHVF